MSGELSFEEPFGHDSDATKIERFLAETSGQPLALRRERTTRFDPTATMTYSPMQYIGVPWELELAAPSDEWTVEALDGFVRSEFPAKPRQTLRPPAMPVIATSHYLPDGFLEAFLRDSEDAFSIAWGNQATSPLEMATGIYDLLCDKRIGSSRNRDHNPADAVIESLAPVIEQESRLLFILPGFPFKDQNLFRVPYEASEPDLADLSFMIRLHRLTQAIYQIHPFGADVLVLTDGSLYAEIFGVALSDADLYGRRMLSYRNQLNLQGTVSFFPLLDLIARTTDGGSAFWNLVDQLEGTLRRVSAERSLRPLFDSLSFGMRRNMQTRQRLEELSFSDSWSLIWGEDARLQSTQLTIRRDLDRLVERATLRYAAVNLALKSTRLIERSFPGALRGTVHAKPGQFALAGTGGAYAWNGVAGAKDQIPRTIDDVSVKSYSELGQGHAVVDRYMFRDGHPAFFLERSR